MKKILLSSGIALSILVLSACSKKAGDGADDTTNSELGSTTSQVGEVLLGASSAIREAFTPERGSCISTLPFSSCSSEKQKTRSFSTSGGDSDGCTRGTGTTAVTVFGKSILTFSATSCGFSATNDTITRTLSNHYFTDSTGRKILVYTGTGTVAGQTMTSAELQDYSGTSRSGGSILTYTGATSTKLDISGVHRRAIRADGKFGLWHTLYTETGNPLTITESAGTKTVSGTMKVAHNRVKALVTKTFSSTTFTSGCFFPTGGSILFSVVPESGSTTNFTLTFSSTCGQATDSSTGSTITLSNGN